MTIQLYLVPVVHLPLGGGRNYNVPKYMPHRLNPAEPGLEGIPWAWVTYLLEDTGVIATDVDDVQHVLLSGQTDVLAIPALDNIIANATIRDRVSNALEVVMIPGSWVTIGMTYRQVLRVVLGVFQFHNRFVALIQVRIFDGSLNLGMTVSQIPQAKRARLQEAADDLSLDYSAVTGSTTIREMLRMIGNQFATHEFTIKGAGLNVVI